MLVGGSSFTTAAKLTISESADSLTSRTNYADFTIDTRTVANTVVLGTNRGGTSTWGGNIELASLGTNELDFGISNIGWTLGSTLTMKGYAVASLPASPGTGAVAYVTDQTTVCPSLGGTFTGGGSVKCLAFYNGSSWIYP